MADDDILDESVRLLLTLKVEMNVDRATRIFEDILVLLANRSHADSYAALAGVIASLARSAPEPAAVAPMLQFLVKEVGEALAQVPPAAMLN